MSLDRFCVWGKSELDSAAIHAQSPWDEFQAALAPASLHTKISPGRQTASVFNRKGKSLREETTFWYSNSSSEKLIPAFFYFL